jgi:hypothetical protein
MNYEYGRVEFLEWAYNMLKFSRLMVYYANLYSATLVACLTWYIVPIVVLLSRVFMLQ